MADEEVDALVRPLSLALAVALVVAAVAALPLAPGARAASPAATSGAKPITGNVSGPALVAVSSNATFYFNASGGPAYVNGTFIGTISWNATLVATNLTGVSVSPSTGTITNATVGVHKLTVTTGTAAETLTLVVAVKSQLGASNATANLTRTFRTVVPYTVHATLIVGPDAAVLPFNVTVSLDGTHVGTVEVPKLSPNETYPFAFSYPVTGLSSGKHTFTLSVADARGLVTFANGLTVESTTFYVPGAAPNYTVWYVVGVVAFFGVLFIYATRVAARRRGSARR